MQILTEQFSILLNILPKWTSLISSPYITIAFIFIGKLSKKLAVLPTISLSYAVHNVDALRSLPNQKFASSVDSNASYCSVTAISFAERFLILSLILLIKNPLTRLTKLSKPAEQTWQTRPYLSRVISISLLTLHLLLPLSSIVFNLFLCNLLLFLTSSSSSLTVLIWIKFAQCTTISAFLMNGIRLKSRHYMSRNTNTIAQAAITSFVAAQHLSPIRKIAANLNNTHHRTYNNSSKSNKVFLYYTPRDPRLRIFHIYDIKQLFNRPFFLLCSINNNKNYTNHKKSKICALLLNYLCNSNRNNNNNCSHTNKYYKVIFANYGKLIGIRSLILTNICQIIAIILLRKSNDLKWTFDPLNSQLQTNNIVMSAEGVKQETITNSVENIEIVS